MQDEKTKKKVRLPQLILVQKPWKKEMFLQRFPIEAGKPKADLTFQEDSKEDSRIIAIKYQVPGEKSGGSIFYYSENANKKAIVTFNLGYNYEGVVLGKNNTNHNLGFILQHLSKENLRGKHLERINGLEYVRDDLTPRDVARKYERFVYRLQKFI